MRVRISILCCVLLSLAASCDSDEKRQGTDAGQPAADAATESVDSGMTTAPDAGVVPTCADQAMPREIAFEHDGVQRSALLAGPATTPGAPVALVLNFHGHSDSPEQEEVYSDMSAHAMAQGYVVAYPRGTGGVKGWNAGACCGTPVSEDVDDVGFTVALIDAIAQVACIDTSRVYAVGYSNGGFFSHRLACELSDKIAGIASVAGVMGMPQCDPAQAVPVLQMHGTYDPVVVYGGGGLYGYESVAATMDGWKQRLGCSDTAPTTVFEQGDTVCKEWVGCDQPLRLCTVDEGGHTWPGGGAQPFIRGKVSSDLNATEMMWEFFNS